MKNYLFACLLAIATFMSANAQAMTVFDPRNYAQNVVTAARSILIDNTTLAQKIYQFNQLKTMYQNLQSLDGVAHTLQINDITNKISELETYKAANDKLANALGEQDDFITRLQRTYVSSNSGVDMATYVQQLAKQAAYGDLKARDLFDMASRAAEDVARTQQYRKQLQEQNANNDGIQKSAQTTNQYLDVLVGQNADLQRMLAENVKAIAEEKARQSAKDLAVVVPI